MTALFASQLIFCFFKKSRDFASVIFWIITQKEVNISFYNCSVVIKLIQLDMLHHLYQISLNAFELVPIMKKKSFFSVRFLSTGYKHDIAIQLPIETTNMTGFWLDL